MRKSSANLIWIDARVFWKDMDWYHACATSGVVIQSPLSDLPINMWTECIELTFNGANKEDLFEVYNQMFNCHSGDRSVIRAVKCANKILGGF